MKNVFIFTTILLVFAANLAMGQAQKTLIKSIATKNMKVTTLELPGKASISEWDNSFMRITVTIDVSNTSKKVLKKLVTVGRYDIKTSKDGDNLIISLPKVAQFVTVKGVDLIEVLKFEVQMPYGVKANVTTPSFYNAAQQAM